MNFEALAKESTMVTEQCKKRTMLQRMMVKISDVDWGTAKYEGMLRCVLNGFGDRFIRAKGLKRIICDVATSSSYLSVWDSNCQKRIKSMATDAKADRTSSIEIILYIDLAAKDEET